MPTLTKTLIDDTKPGDQDLFLWDEDVKGFGCRITPAGVRSFVVQYRAGHGRGAPSRRYTIGKFGSPWTVVTARREARRLLGLVAAGEDPQADRMAQAKAEQAKREKARAAAKDTGRAHLVEGSVAWAYSRFKTKHLSHLRSGGEIARVIEKDVVPEWGATTMLAEIRKSDLLKVGDRLMKRNAPAQANRTIAAGQHLLNWAEEHDLIATSPAQRVPLPSPKVKRDRHHTDNEIRLIWRASERLGYPYGKAVQMIALTGQRREEVSAMEWSELDLDGDDPLWTIPPARSKNEKPHLVHLAPEAVALLRALPRRTDKAGKASVYVFSSLGSRPLTGWSGKRRELAALIRKILVEEGAEGADLPRWVLHDFRRTITHGMARLKVPPHISDKILNHTDGEISGVAAVYNLYEYYSERSEALHLWAKRVMQIVGGNIVPLRPAVVS
ncbi:tyrosine-type recombinase/integrase [Inquilinus sp. CA228]|uniref:tyrosine-type recombinase/integrase n=1 Tax=Inquilinus sp. CA228 TaxID=3455609 RepID=UPI003F8D2686